MKKTKQSTWYHSTSGKWQIPLLTACKDMATLIWLLYCTLCYSFFFPFKWNWCLSRGLCLFPSRLARLHAQDGHDTAWLGQPQRSLDPWLQGGAETLNEPTHRNRAWKYFSGKERGKLAVLTALQQCAVFSVMIMVFTTCGDPKGYTSH